MAFTIEDALILSENYNIKLIAGKNGRANSITWTLTMEDTSMINQLWGKELVIIEGTHFNTEMKLLELARLLNGKDAVGLLIHLGPHIKVVPTSLIDYCNTHDFPLLTVKTSSHMLDLVKDFSMRSILNERDDTQIADAFKLAFTTPSAIDEARNILRDDFDTHGHFSIMSIGIAGSEHLDMIQKRRLLYQIQICFEKIECGYSIFWFDGNIILVLNNYFESLEELIENTLSKVQIRMKDVIVRFGISSNTRGLSQIPFTYKRANAALTYAKTFDEKVTYFDQMGIYSFLFTIEDMSLLKEYYKNTLVPIQQYDEKHHSELLETLYTYLLYDGNQQTIAKKMYMHRNTINYRLNKIKEIVGSDLETFDDKMKYRLGFYIKEMLEDTTE